MSDVTLIVIAGVITFASRLIFLVRPIEPPTGRVAAFLDVFPLALFIALATAGLVAPDGRPELTPALFAAAGGVVGAAVFRRSLWGVIMTGAVFYLAAGWVFG